VQKWTVEKTFTPENYLISGRFCPTQENVGSQIRLALLLNTNKRRRNTAEELNDRITTFPDPLLLEKKSDPDSRSSSSERLNRRSFLRQQ
jgi:hypothetical protein